MEAGSTSVCSRCGQPNPNHGVWCRQCGGPLSQLIEATPAGLPQATLLAANIELYGRVLEDLKGLAARREIPAATYDTIQAFYADRLAERQSQEATRLRAAAVQKFASAARNLAHAPGGRLHEAIHTLEDGLRKYPDENALAQMLQEIRAQAKERERALIAANTARDLVAAAQFCLRESRIDEAEIKLHEALTFDPGNKEILATLSRAQRMREEAKFHPTEPAPAAPVPANVARQDTAVSRYPAPTFAPGPAAEPQDIVDASIVGYVADRRPAAPSFDEEEIPSPTQRWVEAASEWSKVLKPFLLDNVGWFVGGFLVVAGFVVLITTFWGDIEGNQILMLSLVYFSLFATTGLFFSLAYFLRVKHPELETSSNVLLIIVALLIPLVFAAAALTMLVPAA